MPDIGELDVREIRKILPHRYPFLLVDRIIELESGKRAVGIKNVTINEFFFTGHFPDYPIMPGVLITEALAQVGGLILLGIPGCEGKLAVLAGIEGMRFRKPVFPGDQLRLDVSLLKIKGSIGKLTGKATVNDVLVAEGEIFFSLSDQNPNGTFIHPTASVHRQAKLGKQVNIGPNVTIGPHVTVGDRTKVDAGAVIVKWTTLGTDCHIHVGAVLGNTPQDLKYQGEKTELILGDRNTIREYATIHLASSEGKKTTLGNDNLIMGNTHIAHNCQIGNQVIIGNFSGITGHVTIEDNAIIGGLTGIHQFVRIGRLAMIGGLSKVTQDVTPFTMATGNPAQIRGLNLLGLQRQNLSKETIRELKKTVKILYFSSKNRTQALAQIHQEIQPTPEVTHLLKFVEATSIRGITKKVNFSA